MVDRAAGDLGLVPLEVDDDPGSLDSRGDLGDAVGAGRVVGAGHHGLAAESRDRLGDPRIVGGDDDPFERLCSSRGLDDVLDQRPPGVG